MVKVIDPGQEARQVKGPIDPIEIARLVSKGYTAQEAADEMGYSMWSVRDNARQMGLRFKDPRGFTPQQVELAVELRRRGYSLQQIADEVGKSKTGVRRLLVRMGGAS